MGLRAQRAKVMKFRDGYLISTGDPKNYYIQESVRHVLMRQGVLGVKVKIMLAYDKDGLKGTSKLMPDWIKVLDPKEDGEIVQPGLPQAALEEAAVEEIVEEKVPEQAYEQQEAQAYQGGQQYGGGEEW